MKATLCVGLICECGHHMCNCDRPDRNSVMCVNRECELFEKKFSIPTIELSEAASEWEALMTR